MLATNLRFTQTQDPTGRPRALDGNPTVTATSYRNATTRPSVACPSATATTTGAGWSFIGFDAMPKVDLHPDRWPPLSPS